MSFNSKKKGNIHFKVYLAFPFLDELVDEGPEELVPALRDVVAPQLEKMFKIEVGRTFLKKIKTKNVEKKISTDLPESDAKLLIFLYVTFTLIFFCNYFFQ